VPLRFLVKTATTVSVVFHSFPDVFFFAVLLRNQGGITAEPQRCHCGHGDPIELPLRFDGGATTIIGCSTAGPLRYHCGAGGATGVALRQQGGSMTSARRLDKGGGFRSNSLQFSLLLRTLLLLFRLLLLSLVMPPKRPTRGVGKAIKTTPTPTPPYVESSHDEHDDGAACPSCSSSSSHQGDHCLFIFCLQLLHMQQLLHDDQISVIICHSVELSILTGGVNCLKTFRTLKIVAEKRGFYTTK